MRPGSRGMIGGVGGAPPGTGIRPGSGMRTALRTGQGEFSFYPTCAMCYVLCAGCYVLCTMYYIKSRVRATRVHCVIGTLTPPTSTTSPSQVGAGTQAAGGVALNMSVNVTDRPMTGQGVMGMKSSAGSGGRLVEDTSYYVGLLRKKMKVR
jgi:hypothetical protein